MNRLTKLLTYLQAQHPEENWRQYLGGQGGGPDWSRIVISGFSQGAGMAAFIAKREPVPRVVCFSGPSDLVGQTTTLAPWIVGSGVTPPARWFVEYHKREPAATALAQAYSVMKIPSANLEVFDIDVAGAKPGTLPFHVSTVSNGLYGPLWRTMFGKSP
jgi:hypothetical protein